MRSALFLHNTSPSSSWISPSKRYSSTSLRHIDFLIWLACLNGTDVSRTGQPHGLAISHLLKEEKLESS